MFEKVQQFQNTNQRYVEEMVLEAMSIGRPAANRKAWGVIFDETCEFVKGQFEAGRDWVEYDWRFLNGRAAGIVTFHKDGTLYGCYHFI